MCARVPREQVFIRYITGSLYLVGISFPFIKMEFTLNAYMCGYTIQATASEPFKLEPNKQNGERRKALKIQITRHNFRNVDVHIQVDCITLVLVNKSSLKYTMRNKLSYTHTHKYLKAKELIKGIAWIPFFKGVAVWSGLTTISNCCAVKCFFSLDSVVTVCVVSTTQGGIIQLSSINLIHIGQPPGVSLVYASKMLSLVCHGKNI